MCTVIIRVEPGTAWPVTLLALRDESPERPWDPPGAWWPEIDPAVHGVHDRSAGGAWLATSDRTNTLAVVLNRWELVTEPAAGWTTRGVLPLAAVVGEIPADVRASRAFNLLRADVGGVTITAWNGADVVTTRVGAGIHMLTERGPDDSSVPRIARWLEEFRATDAPTVSPGPSSLDRLVGTSGRSWAPLAPVETDRPTDTAGTPVRSREPEDPAEDVGWGPWLDLLAAGTALDPDDPAAIIRDETVPAGRFATLSVVAAAVGSDGVVVRHARLGEPARIDVDGLVRHA